MKQVIEERSGGVITKYPFAQRGSVQAAIEIEHLRAEGRRDV